MLAQELSNPHVSVLWFKNDRPALFTSRWDADNLARALGTSLRAGAVTSLTVPTSTRNAAGSRHIQPLITHWAYKAISACLSFAGGYAETAHGCLTASGLQNAGS
jgi:hypothetical protein